MTSDFLSKLDDAVEGRCACGCGRDITDASPSAYYASEACQDRWHRPAAIAAWTSRTQPATSQRQAAAPTLAEVAERLRANPELAQACAAAMAESMARICAGAAAAAPAFERLARETNAAATALGHSLDACAYAYAVLLRYPPSIIDPQRLVVAVNT